MNAVTITAHAERQARAKRIPLDSVLCAATDPSVTYPCANRRQVRRIRDGIVTVVDLDHLTVVTVYFNCVRTESRIDQRVSNPTLCQSNSAKIAAIAAASRR